MLLCGFGAVSAGIGFVVSIPQLTGALMNPQSVLSVDEVVRNIGIDLGAAGACAFLFNQDWKVRLQSIPSGAWLARLSSGCLLMADLAALLPRIPLRVPSVPLQLERQIHSSWNGRTCHSWSLWQGRRPFVPW